MPAPITDIDLLTPADAARILGLSVDMVRILASNGQLATAAKTTRGARLFRREDVEELAATRAGRPVRQHAVQLYESDQHLAGVVAGYLADALRAGGPAVVIATAPHRDAFVEGLRARDVTIDDAIETGQVRMFDARETLDQFLLDGVPDEQRFRERVGPVIEELRQRWPRARLRAYGEMVDLLWKEERRDAAIELEAMWNRFCDVQPFSLLCAYEMGNFRSGDDSAAFDRICDCHTRVVPTEAFRQNEREIARLQQRAKALETELARRKQAEADLGRALQAKDEILAMLGHELRNPLAPIMTAIELLRLKGDDSREHGIIARHVGHLHRLVDDLLDVGRLLRGKVQLDRQRIEAARVVAHAIELAGDVVADRRHDLEIAVTDDRILVDVDLERIAQALANLLRNAVENSAPGSTIAITVTRAEAGVVFTIEDRGAGISPELLPHVFDLFVQRPQAIDRSAGGLGIGLAITKNLVELHGGRVAARSGGAGKGSELIVTLPAAEGELSSEIPTPAPAIGQRRILIVDDNEDAAAMLGELLSECGHLVQIAHSADAALATARHFEPELALLDLGLPIIDGYELARRLRDLDPDLRLIAVSGYGDCATKVRSAEAGCEAHLVKPVKIGELLMLLAS